jgi:hypothetical protein
LQFWLATVQLIAPWLYGAAAVATVLLTLRAYILFWLADQKQSRLSVNRDTNNSLTLSAGKEITLSAEKEPTLSAEKRPTLSAEESIQRLEQVDRNAGTSLLGTKASQETLKPEALGPADHTTEKLSAATGEAEPTVECAEKGSNDPLSAESTDKSSNNPLSAEPVDKSSGTLLPTTNEAKHTIESADDNSEKFLPAAIRASHSLASANDARVNDSVSKHLPAIEGRRLPVNQSTALLAPVEFAYLMRRGDTNHALAVLAVDLIQRAVKSQTSSSKIRLAKYELRMWDFVKDSIKNWAQEKKDQLLLEGMKKDPVAYVRRMSGIYRFFRDNLATFVVQVTKDPRHLRKYFSFAGIFKLLADFSTAGYQQSFESELKNDLIERGLLVTEDRKLRAAQACFVTAVCGLSVVLIAFCQPLGFGICLSAFLATTIARAILFVKELIPYYGDVLDLLGHIHRRNWRITLFKGIVGSVRIAFHTVSILTFAGGFLGIYLFVHFFQSQLDVAQTYVLTLTLCILIRLCLDSAITGWQILLDEWPTNRGKLLAMQTRDRIKSASPLEEFISVLQTGDYDQTFSEMVALYGIETLFFLA